MPDNNFRRTFYERRLRLEGSNQRMIPNNNFRHTFGKVVIRNSAPNEVAVSGNVLLGDPEPLDERWVQYVIIADEAGNIMVKRKLGVVDIPAGMHSKSFPYKDRFELARGTYRVALLSATPQCKFAGNDISVEGGVIGWHSELVEVN